MRITYKKSVEIEDTVDIEFPYYAFFDAMLDDGSSKAMYKIVLTSDRKALRVLQIHRTQYLGRPVELSFTIELIQFSGLGQYLPNERRGFEKSEERTWNQWREMLALEWGQFNEV